MTRMQRPVIVRVTSSPVELPARHTPLTVEDLRIQPYAVAAVRCNCGTGLFSLGGVNTPYRGGEIYPLVPLPSGGDYAHE